MKRLLAQSIQAIVNIEFDRASAPSANPRQARRPGWHNGYSWRKLATRLGTIELLVPHARNSKVPTQLFDRFPTREAGFLTALGRMCVRGIASPAAVRTIAEDLCGHPFTSEAVNTLVQQLDAELANYLRRQLEREHPSLSAHLRMRSGVLHFADA